MTTHCKHKWRVISCKKTEEDWVLKKQYGKCDLCDKTRRSFIITEELMNNIIYKVRDDMTTIKNYEKACVALAKKFSHIYSNGDYYFVGNDIGGICDFGDDLFLDSHDQVMVLELDPSVDEFYEAWNEWVEEDFNVNLENLIRYGVKQMKEINDKNNT